MSGLYSSSSPACLDEVRLRLEAEKKELQGQKSSSLTNINQKAKTAANRRRSLPGTPTRGRNGRGVNSLTLLLGTFAYLLCC